MRRSAIFGPFWSSAILFLPITLAGCAQTSTYGTGEMPEVALFREVTGGILNKEEKAPIEYQPRAPLVMPPAAGQLPPPVESGSTASADWPVDPNERVASADARANDDNPFNDVNQAEYRRLRPLAGVLPDTPRNVREDESGKEEYYNNIVHGRAQREAFSKAIADEKGYGRSERRFLTDPPLTYRDPVGTAPTEFEDIQEDGNFLTRWWRRR